MNGKAIWSAALALSLGLGSVTAHAAKHAPPEAAWPPKTFTLGGWCSPPDAFITTEQYRKMADVGFTVVLPPCEGDATVARNKKILDTAKTVGLKAIVSDARMPLSLKSGKAAEDALKAIVSSYKNHPALMGYFIADEPGADAFADLSAVVAELHKLDPQHLAYINLLPNYATNDLAAKPSQLNTQTYEQYLGKFMQTVKPDVLSWDNYSLTSNGDRLGFFSNLQAGQRASLAVQPYTPFWNIVLAVKHGPYRALNENELRFEAMQTLAYGAKGLIYFTYWQPNDPSFQWSNAILNRDGTPGPLYESAKKVNQEVKNLEKWLYNSYAISTFQTGENPPDGREQPNDVPVKSVGNGNLTIGTFRDGEGHYYVMVTNRDYAKGVSASIKADAGKHAIEQLDLTTNKWQPTKGKKDDDDVTQLTFELGPSGVALIRWL